MKLPQILLAFAETVHASEVVTSTLPPLKLLAKRIAGGGERVALKADMPATGFTAWASSWEKSGAWVDLGTFATRAEAEKRLPATGKWWQRAKVLAQGVSPHE